MIEYDDSSNSSNAAFGSSYSLSHGSSSRQPPDSSSSHSSGSWFGWLAKFDSSRDKGVEGGDGGMDMRMAAETKPRNEHEEVQVGMNI